MNHHHKITALLLTGALALTVPALAQSGSGSSSGSPGSGSGSQSPGSTRQTDRSTTTTTTTPSTSGTSSTSAGASGSMNSTNANTNADLNASAGFYGPGASQFKNIDTDSDGRISRAEFTTSASTASSLTAGTDTSATSSTDKNGKPEKKHWWSRRSDKGTDDMDPSETFTKLDTDNDGFLSQSELANANSKLKK